MIAYQVAAARAAAEAEAEAEDEAAAAGESADAAEGDDAEAEGPAEDGQEEEEAAEVEVRSSTACDVRALMAAWGLCSGTGQQRAVCQAAWVIQGVQVLSRGKINVFQRGPERADHENYSDAIPERMHRP